MKLQSGLRPEMGSIKEFGQLVLKKEIQALTALTPSLDFEELEKALLALNNCKGNVLITGSGTSSTVARRLAHTLTCSKLPAFFIDSGQSIHGYSSIMRSRDILVCFSRGGETNEVNFLAKIAKEKNVQVISILEDINSTLAKLSEIVIIAAVNTENEPLNTLPLSHTIIQAAVGDILCSAINVINEFDPKDFIKYHPGGAVGKQI